MSVEFEVRLGSETIFVRDLVTELTHELKARFARGQLPDRLLAEDPSGVLGGEARVVGLALDESSTVEARVYAVGPERELGEDGGWWVCLSAGIRSPESVLVALITAACLARLCRTQVLDDALMLKRKRWLTPEDVFEIFGSDHGLSFRETALRLNTTIS